MGQRDNAAGLRDRIRDQLNMKVIAAMGGKALGSGFLEQVEVMVVGGRDQLFDTLGGVVSGSASCKACGGRP